MIEQGIQTGKKAWAGVAALMVAVASFAGAACAQSPQSARPTNDDFERAQPFRAANGAYLTSGYWYGSTRLATDEDGEPFHAGNYGGKSVWFTWVAPYSGPVTFTTAGSNFDTLLAAYRGFDIDSLVRVAANDNASARDLTSAIRFNAVAGTTYSIAIDGYNDARNEYDADPEDADSGSYRLNIVFGSGSGGSGARPANDDFFRPTSLGSSWQTTLRGTSLNATREAYEPAHAGRAASRSVWFSWTAPATGYVQLSSAGSSFQAALAAYYGTGISSLRAYGSGIGSARFYAVRGYTYRIALDGVNGASGNYTLTLRQVSETGI